MDPIEIGLPMAMTMAAFAGISWYIGAELNVSLFLFFKRRRGLYFWSCALGSWGIILQSLFIILADFGVWTDLKGSITFIYLSWLLMVIPQSWVQYSRLYLLMQHDSLLRWVRAALIVTTIIFGVTTLPIGILAQTTQPSLGGVNRVWDRLQTTVFFVQETILSIMYIWQTRKHIRDLSPLLEPSQSSIDSATARAKSGKTKTLLHHLLYINVLIISLDIALLGVQYASLFYLQGAFKPAIYGVKLKLEFVILNRLIETISRHDMTTLSSDVRRGSDSDPGGISVTRGWNVQWPSNASATEDERQLKTPHLAHHQASAEYLGDLPPLHVV
ncbi:integral membrane protein [Hypoxylon argillaceum]|nr:integral membrane protein [Hypoxylon argillaceum]KAI1153941.1 integral membrane protein [Nemania diffusa]